MPAKKSITSGMRFGRLVAIAEERGKYGYMWRCKCDCGNEKTVYLAKLKSGHTRSCGCLYVEHAAKINVTHGMRHTPEYNTWLMMRARCNKRENKSFANYGGRGIQVCDRWNNSFEAFFADMGKRPNGTSIDRVDVNGNYEPSNCRWATIHEQSRNMRCNRYIEYAGKRQLLFEWCIEYGIRYSTVRSRIARGMNPIAAFTTPKMNRWSRRKIDVAKTFVVAARIARAH